MGQKQIILRGAFILTAAGFLSRIMGFFYRIFLSRIIGAEGLGIYQLIFPIFGLAMALTCSGIQTAIAHFVSGKSALGDKKGARQLFYAGLLLSILLSFLTAAFIYTQADFLAANFLKEERCKDLLRYLAFAVPFASVHACATGYFVGLKRTGIPAVSQLLEQGARILSAFFIYRVMVEKGIPLSPLIAIGGMVFAEMVSALFTLTLLMLDFSRQKGNRAGFPTLGKVRDIARMSAPLSGNRLLISFLQSVEAILIPLRLQVFGYSTSNALSHYGILNGMALPLVLFPSAITGALSTMLVPTVSEAHTLDNRREIARTVEATIKGSLVLGIFCIGVFFQFGPDLGLVLFHSRDAGDYILILGWISPFLYLSTTLASILNGLGKTMTTFLQNACGLLIRILFVWFFIPRFGMTAYLLGLLFSQLVVAFLSVHSLKKYVSFHYDAKSCILLPSFFLLAAMAFLCILDFFLKNQGISLNSVWMLLFRGLAFSGVFLFLIYRLLRE